MGKYCNLNGGEREAGREEGGRQREIETERERGGRERESKGERERDG